MGWSPYALRSATLVEFQIFYDGWAIARGLRKRTLNQKTIAALEEILNDSTSQ